MSVQHPLWEKRLCVMDWLIRPIRAVFFADEQAFNWIQKSWAYRITRWQHWFGSKVSSSAFFLVGGCSELTPERAKDL